MVGKYDMRNWAICENNSAVECYDSTKCHKCGWNPIVTKRRIYALRKKEEKGTLVNKVKEERI